MNLRSISITALTLLPFTLAAQFLDPNVLKKPNAVDAWPTYHGDYSGKRYSTLDQINKSNVATLTLAWAFKALAVLSSLGAVALVAVAALMPSIVVESTSAIDTRLPWNTAATTVVPMPAHSGRFCAAS